MCSACDSTCAKCSSTECLDCNAKHSFQTGDNKAVCLACSDTNCERCDIQTECIKCSLGYYLSGTSCTICSTNCSDCDNTACYKCSTGSFLDGIVCKGCPDSCKACSSLDKCTACVEGYFLNGDVCTSCFENCKICSAIETCTTCKDGFVLNSEKNSCKISTGRECFDSVSECIKCDATNTTLCALCKFGSLPLLNGKCICDSGKLLFSGACID